MNLSELSIRRPVFAWMLMTGLIVFGALCFQRLGVSQMPDVDFPVVNVSLSLEGAAPSVMESQVVDLVEDAVMGIQGIQSVTSTSRQGSANVTIEFDLDQDIDIAVQEVQTRLGQVQKNLPLNLRPPSIRKSNPEDQPIIWLTLSAKKEMPLEDQMIYARDVLFDQFSTLPGVGDIALGGYIDPNLRVWLSTKKLKEYNLSATDVIQSIQSEHADIPSGRLENDKKEFNVRLMGEARSSEEFAKILVMNRSGSPVYRPFMLGKIARIEESVADVRRISRSDGFIAVGLGILKQHGSNAVDVSNAVKAKLAEVKKFLPPQYSLDLRVDSTQFITQSVHELNFTLVLSAIFTSLVCFLFLGSWSSTFNVLLAIPTSIIGAFIVIYLFHFTLNTFTLLGLSLAIGIVVDDAIMMLENIVRHVELGENRFLAALKGSKEITFAALAATLAIAAIFLPVVFMKGIIGRFFYQYGITVTAAVFLSLLEALTLTPMRCSEFLNVSHSRFSRFIDKVMAYLSNGYRAMLTFLLRHRWKTVVVTLLIFAASLLLAKKIPGELVPAQDQSQFMLRFKAKVGSSIVYTNKKFKEAEAILAKIPEVNSVYSTVGGFGGDAVNEGMMFVSLKPLEQRKRTQTEIMEATRETLKKEVKGIQIIAQDLSLRGFTSSRGFPVEFSIQGPDWDTLGDLTQKMMDQLGATGMVADLNTDYQIGMPEVRITPDRAKAARRNVSINDIGSTLNALFGGYVLNSNTRYKKNDHRYDIRIRLEADERTEQADLKGITVRNANGELVPLLDIVSVHQDPALQLISRRDRERGNRVYANLSPGHSQSQALVEVEKIAKKILPPNYHIVLTGNAQTYRESLQSLLFAMLLGIVVSYMVLASQFNSFIHPVAVLIALPFSISGALLALYLGHQSLNMFSIIGLILLLGIVKKNSILLVDLTNRRREEGLGLKDALLDACPIRLRPILMTSVATIAGALPEALSLGPGAETRIPMALAIIGGVLVSTLLTLFVVPCVYSLLAPLESKTKSLIAPEPAF